MHTMNCGEGKKNDTKGVELFNSINENNVVILNDSTGTRLDPVTLKTSVIDLCLCDTGSSHNYSSNVYQTSTFGSDHYPVIVTSSKQLIDNCDINNSFNWNFKKADWSGFADKCDQIITNDLVTDDIQETNIRLTSELIAVASEFIPVKHFNKKNKPCVPWWNDACTKVVKDRNKARNRAQHTGKGEDYIAYKELEKNAKEH